MPEDAESFGSQAAFWGVDHSAHPHTRPLLFNCSHVNSRRPLSHDNVLTYSSLSTTLMTTRKAPTQGPGKQHEQLSTPTLEPVLEKAKVDSLAADSEQH